MGDFEGCRKGKATVLKGLPDVEGKRQASAEGPKDAEDLGDRKWWGRHLRQRNNLSKVLKGNENKVHFGRGGKA